MDGLEKDKQCLVCVVLTESIISLIQLMETIKTSSLVYYEIPDSFVFINPKFIPVNDHGKCSRRELVSLIHSNSFPMIEWGLPLHGELTDVDQVQSWMKQVYSLMLPDSEIDENTYFVREGGNSIDAARIAYHLNKLSGIKDSLPM